MKKVNKLLMLIIGFAAGMLSGSFIRLGFEVLEGRPTSVGGEALILPLIVLLFCFGYNVGKEAKVQRRFHNAYKEGYHDGYSKGKTGKTVVTLSFPEPARTSCPVSDRTGL